jgi:hypothetical protein
LIQFVSKPQWNGKQALDFGCFVHEAGPWLDLQVKAAGLAFSPDVGASGLIAPFG